MKRYRFIFLNGLLLLAVVGSRWGVATDSVSSVKRDFLAPLKLPFRGWKTTDTRLSLYENQILEPDSVIMREYNGPSKESVQLAVIAGDRKKSVHTPGYCMVGDGWEVVSESPHVIHLPGRSIVSTQAVMTNTHDHGELVVTYFFTDGDYATQDLVRFQGHQFLKRLKHEVPLGAMVRIVAPIVKDPNTAARLADDFARATLPPILDSIKEASRPA